MEKHRVQYYIVYVLLQALSALSACQARKNIAGLFSGKSNSPDTPQLNHDMSLIAIISIALHTNRVRPPVPARIVPGPGRWRSKSLRRSATREGGLETTRWSSTCAPWDMPIRPGVVPGGQWGGTYSIHRVYGFVQDPVEGRFPWTVYDGIYHGLPLAVTTTRTGTSSLHRGTVGCVGVELGKKEVSKR